jgi:hypothetical protein
MKDDINSDALRDAQAVLYHETSLQGSSHAQGVYGSNTVALNKAVATAKYSKATDVNAPSEVANTRQSDCPQWLERLSTVLGSILALAVLAAVGCLFINCAGDFDAPVYPFLAAAAVLLALFAGAAGLKSWYQRRAWIRRMRENEEDKRK